MIRHFLRATCFFAAVFVSVSPLNAEGDDMREGGLTGTGIIGEIIALGSIIVNNQRLTFEPDLAVDNLLGPKVAQALVPGDIVAVAVSPATRDWDAVAITQLHPLIGPIDAVTNDSIRLLGIDVAWPGADGVLTRGDWVAISGFWARAVLVPTRLQAIAPQDHVSVQGSYRTMPDGGAPHVGPIRLDIDPLHHAQDGDVIRVEGQWQNGKLIVQDVHLGLFDRPVGLVLAEGYLSDVATSGHYTVSGSGLSSYTDNLEAEMKTERVTVCGVSGALTRSTDIQLTELASRLGCPDDPY